MPSAVARRMSAKPWAHSSAPAVVPFLVRLHVASASCIARCGWPLVKAKIRLAKAPGSRPVEMEPGRDDFFDRRDRQGLYVHQVGLAVKGFGTIREQGAHYRRMRASEDNSELLVMVLQRCAQRPSGTGYAANGSEFVDDQQSGGSHCRADQYAEERMERGLTDRAAPGPAG